MDRAEFERVWDSEEFRQYTERSPCVVTGRGPCVGHHVTPNDDPPSGTGRKADAKWVVPLLDRLHKELHNIGWETFERKYGIDLKEEARQHWARWQRESEDLAA